MEPSALPNPSAPQTSPAEGLTQRTTDQYQALFHAMDQGFCVLELQFDDNGQQVVDFRYQALNPVFSQQSGIPEGVLGKTSREVMPDLEPFWFDTYGRVARTGESVRLEHYVPQVNRWFDVHAFRVGAPAARQVGVLFHDITARKQAEEQLRHAAAADAFRLQLADALAPLADAVAIQEAVTRLTRQHFAADRCYYVEIEGDQGVIRRDAAAEGLLSIAGTYPMSEFALLRAAIAAGQPFSVRDVRQDALVDDSLRQLCVQLQLISCLNVPVLKDGQPVGVLTLAQSQPRDWTAVEAALAVEVAGRTWAAVERARAETARAASEEKYRTLFTSIDEGFSINELLYDERGRPVDALMLETNPRYDQITQTTGAAGRRAREIFPEAESVWFETYAQVVETGESVRFENYFAPLGRWIEMFVARVGGAGSRRFASVFNDITARKQQEQQQTFLLRFSDALRAETSATSVAYRALGMLCEQLQLDRCYIGIYDLAEDRGIFPHQVGNHRIPPLPAGVRLSDFPDALRVAYDRTLRIDDLAQTEGLSDTDRQNLGALGLRALVAATLRRVGAGPQWAIVALSADVRHWTPGEVALLEAATERTWAAMERARAESALAASEEKYRTLFDSIYEGVSTIELLFDEYDHAVDFRYLTVNPAIATMGGLTPEVIGQKSSEVFGDLLEPLWLETFGRVAQTGEPARFEYGAAMPGRVWEVYAARVGGADSREVVVVYTDITERTQAAEQQAFELKLADALRPLSEASEMQSTALRLLGEHLRLDRCGYGKIQADNEYVTVQRDYHVPGVASFAGTYRLEDFGPDIVAAVRRG